MVFALLPYGFCCYTKFTYGEPFFPIVLSIIDEYPQVFVRGTPLDL
jgi:hypothetical protein